MTESDRIIAEVLRLDAEATKGPWVEWNDSVHAGPVKSKTHGMLTGSQGRVCNCHGDDFGDDDEEGEVFAESNAELIASYRTSAPRLARMLRVALGTMAHMRFACEEDEIEAYDEGLAEIEKIAKGEA